MMEPSSGVSVTVDTAPEYPDYNQELVIPHPMMEPASGVSIAVDTEPQYPDLIDVPVVSHPIMEPASGVSITVDTAPDYEFHPDIVEDDVIYKRQADAVPVSSLESVPVAVPAPVGPIRSFVPMASPPAAPIQGAIAVSGRLDAFATIPRLIPGYRMIRPPLVNPPVVVVKRQVDPHEPHQSQNAPCNCPPCKVTAGTEPVKNC
jgi:hypothetical protein